MAELSEKFEILKPPSTFGQVVDDRITQRDITSTAITARLLSSVYTKEVWLPLHPQHTDRWTTNSTYTDVVGSINDINVDDFPDHDFHFEMVGFTDAGTGFWKLVNDTDSVDIGNSEITTTSTTSVRVRSVALPKPSGTKIIKIQHRIANGDGTSEFVNSVMSRGVFRLP